MTKRLLINVTFCENRIAFMEDLTLQKFYMELIGNNSVIGNIYRGKLSKIIPGIQSAFIDIGAERSAFLHVFDILP
ncbi:MAG: Rne/Rng family ribonuclease, partial [Psittacicella sp.]